MIKCFILFFIGITASFFSGSSLGSGSVDQAIQKRIEMFKSSGENLKKLNKLIRSGDTKRAEQLVDFHVTWSEKMILLFPLGSEASTSNGSDASSDIWTNLVDFKNQIRQYKQNSIKLKASLRNKNITELNENFERLVGTCKSCHRQFRN